MEYWDLYDEKRNKLNKVVQRGEKLQDDEYHIVVNAWIRNTKNEFLITQRAATKKFAFMWECTGGSALNGESSLDAAIREVKEELGINVDKSTGKLIGSTLRHYPNCPDIFDVWLFTSDVPIEEVRIQEEEVCKAMWASVDKIKELYNEKKFEANAFFEDVLKNLEEAVYYIGFNANNAICNDNFFQGSITLYPTKERGNIFYSNTKLEDTKSSTFLEEYKKYVYKTAKNIQENNINAKFICFNEKIRKLCSDMKDINIVKSNDSRIIDLLNNKFKTREMIGDKVPTLEYIFVNSDELNYKNITKQLNCDKFVVQGETGAGGDSTILISSENDIKKIKLKENVEYSISKYIKHLPLNVTLIITDDMPLTFPLSAQLILLTDNMFKYVGGDFVRSQNLNTSVYEQIEKYNNYIAEKVKSLGYRGILGIDYILLENDDVIFMEINPRFQSSSFILSQELEKKYNSCVAELHYKSMVGEKVENLILNEVNKSFINCSNSQEYPTLKNYKILENGYFKENNTSVYRKIFEESIIENLNFENL